MFRIKAVYKNCYCLEWEKEMMTLWRFFLCPLRYNREQRIINTLFLGGETTSDHFERRSVASKGHVATGSTSFFGEEMGIGRIIIC